jgi:hypothetical protein
MTGLAVFIVACLGLQVILHRDKNDRKRFKEIGILIEAEKKRRLKEEKLRTVRIKHPKVIYLDDFKAALPTQRII